MSHRRVPLLALSLISVLTSAQPAPLTARLTVDVAKPGHAISPVFFGMMTEEINHAYDGGLYAELIRNRSFTDSSERAAFWTQFGTEDDVLSLDKSHPVPNTTLGTALRVDATKASGQNPIGASNPGYWGIPVFANTTYRLSFYARGESGFHGKLTVALMEKASKNAFATARTPALSNDWKLYTLTLKTGAVGRVRPNAFVVSTDVPGVFELAQVSLFPPTYKNRPNGLRPDLMDLMAGLRPKFLRLPGGNYLEGNTISERFDWKKTLGPIAARPGHPCPWGYPSTDGMGLLEFCQWCEDLKIEPLLGVFAGYALRGQHIDAGPELEPYVQDALDEVEYLTGGIETKWGARRAKDGHPKPFPLHYVEIGNEDWFDRSGSYPARFAQFFDAFRKRYPKLKLIATTPVQSRTPDLIDDHFYRTAEEMERDSNHYDSYDRKGPKIFVGEWATLEGIPTPHLRAALGDAAWLTGLERNSDIVEMEAYAPLFVNVNDGAWQWRTNLIGYDARNSFGSPAYWVQAMFGQNTGDVVLPYKLDVDQVKKDPIVYHGKVGLGAYRTEVEYKELSVTVDGKQVLSDNFTTTDPNWAFGPGKWAIENGVLHQSSDQRGSRALYGAGDWSKMVIQTKARKLSGQEGFMVLFHATSPNQFWQWNIGGWNNNRSAIQHVVSMGSGMEVGQSVPTTLVTGQWYDLRLELADGQIRGYIDGKLITEVREELPEAEPLYVAASKVRKTGEVILKIVNVSNTDADLAITVPGSGKLPSVAKGWILTGDLTDQNSIEHPDKVVPKPFALSGLNGGGSQRFPAHSFTVLRIPAGGR